jgi:hypothetical protein
VGFSPKGCNFLNGINGIAIAIGANLHIFFGIVIADEIL